MCSSDLSVSSRLHVVNFNLSFLDVSTASKFSLKVSFLNFKLNAVKFSLFKIFFDIQANVDESTPPLKYKAMGTSLLRCNFVDCVNLFIN